MERLEQVEIFEFQLPEHGRLVRRTLLTQPQKLHLQLVGVVAAVIYQMAGLNCSFVYGLHLQPAGDITIIQLVTYTTC